MLLSLSKKQKENKTDLEKYIDTIKNDFDSIERGNKQ
jgi:hypothetical protein